MLNTAIIMGRLVADPELKTTPGGNYVTTFAVAVERSYKQGDERQADFIDVVAWKQTAEFITKYFRKGSMIAIQGTIQTRTYEDRNGNKRKAVEIIAQTVSFCGEKAERSESKPEQNNSKPEQMSAQPSAPVEIDYDEDDLPF